MGRKPIIKLRTPEEQRAQRAHWCSYQQAHRARLYAQGLNAKGEPRKQRRLRERPQGMTPLQRYRKYRWDALVHYGGVPPACQCCGEGEEAFLGLARIHHDGGSIRRNPSEPLVQALKREDYPDGYCVLCHNCSVVRRTGKCPHDSDLSYRSLSRHLNQPRLYDTGLNVMGPTAESLLGLMEFVEPGG